MKQAIKLHKDLKKKLRFLSFIHDQSALNKAKKFYELRNTIDIDTEELINRIHEAKLDDEFNMVTKVNETRLEFIRILRELEERCLKQLPKTSGVSSMDVYGDFRKRIDQVKTCPKDKIKDVYVKLALELLDEIHELEKRLFGEQTVFYVSSSEKSQLGNLIFIDGFLLRRNEIECLRKIVFSARNRCSEHSFLVSVHLVPFLKEHLQNFLLVECNQPTIVDQNYMVISRIVNYLYNENFNSLLQFIYTTKDDNSVCSVESSLIDIQVVGYQFPAELKGLRFKRIEGFSQDVLDFLSADKCGLEVAESHLQSLDFLESPHAHRLESLFLSAVHLERFDGSLLTSCVNLTWLKLDIYGSGAAITSLDFLRPLKKLKNLFLALPDFDLDFSVLHELDMLEDLALCGSFDSSGKETRPKMNLDLLLKHISSLPNLTVLKFLSLKIDKIGKHQFVDFKDLLLVLLYCIHGCQIETNKDVSKTSSAPNKGPEIRCKSKTLRYKFHLDLSLAIEI